MRRLAASAAHNGAMHPEAAPFVLEEASVASVHAAYRAGTLSCVQLVQRYLTRIEALDRRGPALRALVAGGHAVAMALPVIASSPVTLS